MKRGCPVGFEIAWWQAKDLVDLALASPGTGGARLEDEADTTLFPPATRPFVRLALDSLARAPGGAQFDLAAVDLLLDQALPLGPPMTASRTHRRAAELALFLEMLAVECRRVAADNTLPVLDSAERIVCRVMAHAARLAASPSPLRAVIDALLARHTAAAATLADRLAPLADAPQGLAIPGLSEPVDYPLRTLRLTGYLGTAAMVHRDRDDLPAAEHLAALIERLWASNLGGALSPVTDDQLIELALT